MKQSLMTGKHIYDELVRLHRELKELGEARDLVDDDLGRDHVAYQILDKQYKEKERELRKTEGIKYGVYESNSTFNF